MTKERLVAFTDTSIVIMGVGKDSTFHRRVRQ